MGRDNITRSTAARCRQRCRPRVLGASDLTQLPQPLLLEAPYTPGRGACKDAQLLCNPDKVRVDQDGTRTRRSGRRLRGSAGQVAPGLLTTAS